MTTGFWIATIVTLLFNILVLILLLAFCLAGVYFCFSSLHRYITAKIRGEFEPEDPDAQSTHTNNFDHCSNLQLYKS